MKTQKRKESITLGERLLTQSLGALGVSRKVCHEAYASQLLAEYDLKTIEDLYAEIGLGNRAAMVVAQRLTNETEHPVIAPQELEVKGTEGMVMRYAHCCRPIPGDAIVGLLDQGAGIMVHTVACQEIHKIEAAVEKYMPLRWEENITGDFPVDITVAIENRRGLLAGLAMAISKAGANIDSISAEDYNGQYFLVHATIEVNDRKQLADVFRCVRQTEGLIRITRT